MTHDHLVVAGRYRLGARLGSGAMGVVWQAQDDRLHRTVAVKQLLLQPGLTPAQAEEARLRSMREGRIAARLSHPNAITVYDAVEHNGDPWLIMEYLPSKSLATVLAEGGALGPAEAARIGSQIAAALVAAHSAGIVHRDVKPANVLLGDDGTVKITDFGISRAVGDVTVTATGMLAGTPAYLAPEVAKGQQPTASSDVFSLGSTLYTAVEGHSPFGLGENTLALLYAVAAGKISPPRQAGPLTALLMRLLRADPAERPTMQEARELLAAIATGRAAAPSAAETTAVIPPVRAATPPRGVEGTRLDARPFSEPLPSGGLPVGGPPPGPPPRARGGTVRSVVLTILAILGAALLGILVASLLTDGRPGAVPPPATTTSTAPNPASPAPSGRTGERRYAAADYEAAVRQYYALLPGDTAAAWALLTERARAVSRGQENYQKFWAGISSVRVLETRAENNRVAATLRFVDRKGKETTEPYSLALIDQGGQLVIDNFVRTGRANLDGAAEKSEEDGG